MCPVVVRHDDWWVKGSDEHDLRYPRCGQIWLKHLHSSILILFRGWEHNVVGFLPIQIWLLGVNGRLRLYDVLGKPVLRDSHRHHLVDYWSTSDKKGPDLFSRCSK